MIQKVLSIVTLLILIGWLGVLFILCPRGGYDGELLVGILVLLDALVFLIGGILVVAAAKRRSSFWIATAVLAVPLMHLLSCMTEAPLDLVLIIFPIALLPFIVIFKWRAIQQPPA